MAKKEKRKKNEILCACWTNSKQKENNKSIIFFLCAPKVYACIWMYFTFNIPFFRIFISSFLLFVDWAHFWWIFHVNNNSCFGSQADDESLAFDSFLGTLHTRKPPVKQNILWLHIQMSAPQTPTYKKQTASNRNNWNICHVSS